MLSICGTSVPRKAPDTATAAPMPSIRAMLGLPQADRRGVSLSDRNMKRWNEKANLVPVKSYFKDSLTNYSTSAVQP